MLHAADLRKFTVRVTIFFGHPKARASASKASGCFMGGTQWCKGGTGKAEDAKLPDAGISLKQWPKKMSGRKRSFTGLSRIGVESRTRAKKQAGGHPERPSRIDALHKCFDRLFVLKVL